MRLLREADADDEVVTVLGVYQDYKAGVLSRWPEGYASWVVDGVRYLDREAKACTAEQHRRLARRTREHLQRGSNVE